MNGAAETQRVLCIRLVQETDGRLVIADPREVAMDLLQLSDGGDEGDPPKRLAVVGGRDFQGHAQNHGACSFGQSVQLHGDDFALARLRDAVNQAQKGRGDQEPFRSRLRFHPVEHGETYVVDGDGVEAGDIWWSKDFLSGGDAA